MIDAKLTEFLCPFCKGDNKEILYQYKTYAGKVLGNTQVTLVMCSSCSFVYNSPRPSHLAINKHYQEASSGAVYREVYAGSRSSTLDLERSAFIERHTSSLEKGRFIDIGCGQGSLLKKLIMPQLKKFGLDPIQNTSKNLDDSVVFINGYIESYKAPIDEKFEVVSCISSLEHYYHPEIVLEKFNNLLVMNGILILEVPDTLKPKGQLAEFFSFEHLSHFTEKSLTRMFNLYGFEIIEFDSNVSIPNLRVSARKIESNYFIKAQENEKLLLKETIDKYIRAKQFEIDRMDLILNPIISDCEINKKILLIYGAGDHTVHLFEHFALETYVSNYIDSDSKKWGTIFREKEVIQPDDIRNISDAIILISSHDYEDEILNTVILNNSNLLEVICLYKNNE